jgi:hypothetical protein
MDKNSRLETNVHDGADQKIMKHIRNIDDCSDRRHRGESFANL